MKKSIKIPLIIVGVLVGIILLDTLQALVLNNNIIIGTEKDDMKKGLLVNTYHCSNNRNITKLKTSKDTKESVCGKETTNNDPVISAKEVNDIIFKYLSKEGSDLSNVAYNYVDEENDKVIVGLLDNKEDNQKAFINKIFTNCCQTDYITYIEEHKVIEFKESKDTFEGKIIDSKESTITLEVLKDSKAFKLGDKVTIIIVRPSNTVNDFYVVDNKLRITFNSMVLESNPAQVGATKVELLS